MKKLLFFPTRYFPAISGAEFYIQRLSEILSSIYEYDISIITSNAIDFSALRSPKGKSIEVNNKYYDKVNNLKIHRYSVDYSLSMEQKLGKLKEIREFETLGINDTTLNYFLSNGPFLHELLEKLIKRQFKSYDLIHTTFFPYFNLIISLLLGKFLDIPTVCTPFFHFSNPRYLSFNVGQVLEKFDIIIACTNLEKEFLIKNYKIPENKIRIIPMGVDFNVFASKTKKQNYRFKEHFFKKGERNCKMVLFCGYKNYEKGALSILKAIPLIIKQYRKVYFVFIGPPTLAFNKELTKLQKVCDIRIINFTPDNLTGYFDKKKVAAFQETDIYLMPSRSDAFGIAFLEAWASGKPVIGANLGATPDVINENEDGLLVEFDNPQDIAAKVVKLLKNKRLRRKLGNSGKEKTENYLTWDIIVKNTHELYQELI
ncbi:MAG: glycosyltransferase family 4 protein [Candidatus Hermodarchaeota archaeon]